MKPIVKMDVIDSGWQRPKTTVTMKVASTRAARPAARRGPCIMSALLARANRLGWCAHARRCRRGSTAAHPERQQPPLHLAVALSLGFLPQHLRPRAGAAECRRHRRLMVHRPTESLRQKFPIMTTRTSPRRPNRRSRLATKTRMGRSICPLKMTWMASRVRVGTCDHRDHRRSFRRVQLKSVPYPVAF